MSEASATGMSRAPGGEEQEPDAELADAEQSE
jgi:hypothetical protein